MQYFKVEIVINSDGSIVEKVISGSGSDCTKVTEDLNDAIGNTEAQEFLPEPFGSAQGGYFVEDDDEQLLTTSL